MQQEALSQAGYQYVDLDASVDSELRQAVRDVSGSRTVPQVKQKGSLGRGRQPMQSMHQATGSWGAMGALD
jgi:glutaredoxin